MRKGFALGFSLLFFSLLACRPVIAIGWEEFLLLLALIAFLLGPPLYRFLRRLENFRRHERKKK